jgi:hypothetical protein
MIKNAPPGAPPQARRALLTASGIVAILCPLSLWAQEPATAHRSIPVVAAVTGEWVHVGGEGLHRDASQSMTLILAHDRPNGLRLELGYLRVARSASNAEGLTAGVGFPVRTGRLTLRPGLSMLVGAAEAGVDQGGYNWQGTDGAFQGQTGNQGRPLDANGTTVGGGLSLSGEYPLLAGISLSASVRQWLFSGSIISSNRAPTLAGLGLSVNPNEMLTALRGRRTSQNPAATSGEGL